MLDSLRSVESESRFGDPLQATRSKNLLSSVVMPFYHNENQSTGLVLTMRSKNLKSHPGQISFPGGMQEPNEAIFETGLREWEEEMGVSRELLEVIGAYKSFDTRTGFHITPIICKYLGQFDFSINPAEVETWFRLDLAELQELDFYSMDYGDKLGHRIHYFDLGDRGLLWGATCEIILNFLHDFTDFQRKPIVVQPNLTKPPFFQPPSK
ncbi:NUDIX hydrolase [Leptospira sp. GIMC2001]|uniref:NUDIX hydrolase n=1 Tax=Leptospira sp. GIMC2001 TaxID=1513297 RepID=UPI00234BBCE5|nr:CoA pyrophosphatase [Leptospira sp. GIMC2001]WCL49669.1 CoA pyrophosphatase [Leptospira sp. GIMC2001]